MRLWSIHPSLLDSKGLVACWRETLLAQKVLAGHTRGYRQHPQLQRFREQEDPLASIGCYLQGIHAEACARGYNFDATKILFPHTQVPKITVTKGQVDFEIQHLRKKLEERDPQWLESSAWHYSQPPLHALFTLISGPIAEWERP